MRDWGWKGSARIEPQRHEWQEACRGGLGQPVLPGNRTRDEGGAQMLNLPNEAECFWVLVKVEVIVVQMVNRLSAPFCCMASFVKKWLRLGVWRLVGSVLSRSRCPTGLETTRGHLGVTLTPRFGRPRGRFGEKLPNEPKVVQAGVEKWGKRSQKRSQVGRGDKGLVKGCAGREIGSLRR